MEQRVMTISWAALWRVFIFVLFAIVLFLGRDLILALFLAIVISSGLEVVVDLLEQRGWPRTLSVILIFLTAALLIAILIYFIIPFVIVDLNQLLAGDNQALIGKLLAPLRGTEVGKSISATLNQIAGDYFSQSGSPLDYFSRALGGALLAVTILISSFYLSLTKDGVERFMRAVFPDVTEERVLRIYHRARRQVGAWFQSQLLLSLIMWLLVWVVLAILGVPHAFVLGIVAGLLELLPFMGPIISGGLAILIALSVSGKLAFYAFIAFVCVQQFESHVLVPLVTKKVVDLHPVIVIIALLMGFEIAGILGALVSVPLAAVIQEIISARAMEREKADAVI